MDTKSCSNPACGEINPQLVARFAPYAHSRDGLASWCRACTRAAVRAQRTRTRRDLIELREKEKFMMDARQMVRSVIRQLRFLLGKRRSIATLADRANVAPVVVLAVVDRLRDLGLVKLDGFNRLTVGMPPPAKLLVRPACPIPPDDDLADVYDVPLPSWSSWDEAWHAFFTTNEAKVQAALLAARTPVTNVPAPVPAEPVPPPSPFLVIDADSTVIDGHARRPVGLPWRPNIEQRHAEKYRELAGWVGRSWVEFVAACRSDADFEAANS